MNKEKRETPVILELECVKCKTIQPIPQKFTYRTNVCIACRNLQQRKYSYKREKNPYTIGVSGRQPYPLDEKWTHLNQRFKWMQKEINGIEDRIEWRKLISQRLDEVLNNERLYHWILAHKSNEPLPKTSKQNEELEEEL